MAGPLLPMELIYEILILLSVEALLRLRSVSNAWRAIIDDPRFIKKHLHKSRCLSVAYAHTDIDMELPPGGQSTRWFNDVYVSMSECRGLSLQLGFVSSKYSIKNPATRQILDLPNPHMNSLAIEFTYVKSTDEYKVVSLYRYGGLGCNCEILAIGGQNDLVWKQLELPDLIEPVYNKMAVVAVKTGKVVHFVRLVTTDDFHYIQVDSLDLVTETFTTTFVPLDLFAELADLRAFDSDGRLAIGATDVRTKTLHIMTLNDYRQSQWENFMVVYPLGFLESEEVGKALPLVIKKGLLGIWVTGKKLIWYDTRTKTVSSTVIAPENMIILPKIERYSGTLVSLNGMRPDTTDP